MLPPLTPAATRALQAAQQWAGRQGAVDVQAAHLLQGLLEEEEGRAATLLQRAGADPPTVRQRLADLAKAGPPHPMATPLPLSPDVQQIIGQAHELATDLAEDRTVASEHMLLALVRADQELRRLLDSQGLALSRLEDQVLAAQGPPLRLDEPLLLTEPTEQIDAARLFDANANRAREALRVIEDYCRFVLDDPFLSSALKGLRHDLTDALAQVNLELLLEARETLRDVGTAITTPREQERHSLLEVVQANLKRLQEALRSLEEVGKLYGPDLAGTLEQLRYRGYTLERAIVLGTTARQRLACSRLYVLMSGAQCTAALDWTIQEAAAGGATIIQLREKTLEDGALLERARQVRRWTRRAGILFIMNDRPDIARLAEADGVHLGQEEMSVKDARRIVGPSALIGVSTHNLEQVRRAVLDGASYVGVGPTFASGTKEFTELAGLAFVRQAMAETSLPAFVIGGINLDTIGPAVAAGARRVAVSQAICQADDPRQAAQILCQELERVEPDQGN